MSENDKSQDSDRNVLILLDRFTRWLQAYATKTKSTAETVKFFKRFVGPQAKPEHFYSDGAQELIGACKELSLIHI